MPKLFEYQLFKSGWCNIDDFGILEKKVTLENRVWLTRMANAFRTPNSYSKYVLNNDI